MLETNTDYKAWALDMCTLLDAIEMNRHDPIAVHDLCRQRFALAEKHGLQVRWVPPSHSGTA